MSKTLHSSGSGWEPVTGYCEHGDELSVFHETETISLPKRKGKANPVGLLVGGSQISRKVSA
jgi:hypothetical protein